MSVVETVIPPQPTADEGRPKQIGLIADDYTCRMLTAAGLRSGHEFRVLGPELPQSETRAAAELDRFVRGLDLLLCDPSALPLAPIESLGRHCRLHPNPAALRLGRDRHEQRMLLEQLDIPTFPILPVDSRAELHSAFARLRRPAVLKPRDPAGSQRHALIQREQELAENWLLLGGERLVLEPLLPLQRELVLVAVRSATGEMAYYPLAERHPEHPEIWTAPAAAAGTYQSEAASYAGQVLRRLDYVGVLAVSYYLTGRTDRTDRRLLAARITPGLHPAGYWTVEGAFTSQYDNCLRAVLGEPLGTIGKRGYAGTRNLSFPPERMPELMEIGGVQLHIHARDADRRLFHGHVAVQSSDPESVHRRLDEVRSVLRSH